MNFSKSLKLLSKDTLLYGFGGALGKFIGFFTAPILTRIFSPSDYGILDLLVTTLNFFLMFAAMNLNSGIFRHFYEVKTLQEKKRLFSTGFLIGIVLSLILILVLFLFIPQISNYLGSKSDVHRDYQLFLALVFIRIPFNLAHANFLALFRLRRKARQYVIISTSQVLINFTLIILFVVVFRMGLLGAFLAGTIAIITVSLLSLCCNRKYIWLSVSKTYLKKISHYALPQFPAVVFSWLILQMNRFFIHGYCSEIELGYFAIAIKVAVPINLAISAFKSAWLPYAMEIIIRKDHKVLYNKFLRVTMIIFTLFAFIIVLYSKILLSIIAPPEYMPAFLIVIFIVFGNTVDAFNQILGIGIAISKRTKFTSYAVGITFIFALIFNFFLIKKYMAIGAGLALMLSYFTKSFLIIVFSRKVYPIRFSYNNFYHYFLILSISIAAVFAINDLSMINSLILIIPINIVVFIYVTYVWLYAGERQKIYQFTKKKILKINVIP